MILKSVNHVEFYVRDERRYARMLKWMGFEGVGSTFRSGCCELRLNQPSSNTAQGADFLEQHPDGVGVIAFTVEDVWQAATMLEDRGATLVTDIQVAHGVRWFDITTPIGDLMFRFTDARSSILPGPYGQLDHFTCHFMTMSPVIAWFEKVMGFERFWAFQFHTRRDCKGMEKKAGTGMKSEVMRCPNTGISFALNEPLRPDFTASQVTKFVRDNRGPGVQHIALTTPDICDAVRKLSPDRFLRTPGCYYDELGNRLAAVGVQQIDQDIEQLRPLGVLVDGEESGHLLQIFMRCFADLHADTKAGPFFFELIERHGARGFGHGNFRSLFEAVERSQQA